MLKRVTSFIVLMFLFTASVFIGSGCTKKEESSRTAQEVVICSFGGTFTDAQRTAYYTPFTKETGIAVKEAEYNGEYGKIKAMVRSGNIAWDVVDAETSALVRGTKEGLFEPIDYSQINSSELLPEAVHKYGVGTDFYSVALCWSNKFFPTGAAKPKSWKDFWDTKKFPGPRCLKKDPRFTLEIALMADGVPFDKIYSPGLDLDRAFKSLDKIKNSVKVWWSSGHQPIQLLSDGEIAMAAAFGARIWIAKNKENKPVDLTWNQGIMDAEYWVIPKGCKNKDLAMKFIAFASQAKNQAKFPELFPLGPTNKNAFKLMDQTLAKEMNTYPGNYEKHLILNAEWWAEHEAEVTERWNAWLVKN